MPRQERNWVEERRDRESEKQEGGPKRGGRRYIVYLEWNERKRNCSGDKGGDIRRARQPGREGGKRGKKEERREIREKWKGAKKAMAGYEVVGDESAGESE